jgi:predicted permease
MLGLLEKDVRLILKRKQTLLVFLVMAVIFTLAGNGSFIVGYLTMLAGIVAVSTLSYDEYDNGYEFLLTLPIDRKTFVREKYLFCLGLTTAAWCIAVILYYVGGMAKQNTAEPLQSLQVMIPQLPLMFLLSSFVIPLQLKFGVEKSRLVLFGVFGAAAVLLLLAKNYMSSGAFAQIMADVPATAILAAIATLMVVLFVCFYFWSIRIMEKKEL